MYLIGDLIVYGSTGVCRVKAIGPAPGARADKEYYTLEPLYQSCVIYAPLEGGHVPARPVITRAEAEELVESIAAAKPAPLPCRDLRQLTARYESALKLGDCAELAALSMSIYQKKQEAALSRRRLSQTDERFMKQAEGLLFGELAVALGMTPEEIPDYIAARVEQNN